MRLTVRVDWGRGPEVVTTDLWAVVSWERKTGSKLSALSHSVGADDLGYLVHNVLARAGGIPPYDEWLRQVVDLEVIDEEPDADPTRRARPAEPSP